MLKKDKENIAGVVSALKLFSNSINNGNTLIYVFLFFTFAICILTLGDIQFYFKCIIIQDLKSIIFQHLSAKEGRCSINAFLWEWTSICSVHIAIFKLLSHMVGVNFICIEIWRKLLTDDSVGPCRVRRKAEPAWWRILWPSCCPWKTAGACGSRSRPSTSAWGGRTQDVYGEKTIATLAFRAIHSRVLSPPVLSADGKSGDL